MFSVDQQVVYTYTRVLPRLETKAEWVDMVWAEFMTIYQPLGMIHQKKTSIKEKKFGRHRGPCY